MEEEKLQGEVEPLTARMEETCDPRQVLKAMNLLETGVRQAFLDGEFGVEDTKDILNQIAEARKRCEAGDVAVCSVLNELVTKLTKEPEG